MGSEYDEQTLTAPVLPGEATDSGAWLSRLAKATSPAALATVMEEVCAAYGFEHFWIAMLVPSSIQRPDMYLLHNCPELWSEPYVGERAFCRDPLVRRALTHSTPLLWSQVREACLAEEDWAGLGVMARAAQAGLQDGVTLPWHGPHGHIGLCTLISATPRALCAQMPLLAWLSGLAVHVLAGVSRLCPPPAANVTALSDRELEVCQWAAEGKQARDIGMILGITPRTVTFHMMRVADKLGASNNSQAISWALKRGKVTLNVSNAQVRLLERNVGARQRRTHIAMPYKG